MGDLYSLLEPLYPSPPPEVACAPYPNKPYWVRGEIETITKRYKEDPFEVLDGFLDYIGKFTCAVYLEPKDDSDRDRLLDYIETFESNRVWWVYVGKVEIEGFWHIRIKSKNEEHVISLGNVVELYAL